MWVSWKFGTFATRSVRNFAARHLNMGSVCQKDSIADVQSHLGFVDTIVADDLVEGGLKEVQIKSEPPISVILSKRQGKLSAIGNKCTRKCNIDFINSYYNYSSHFVIYEYIF